jgi:hypothetical protein
VKAMFKAPEVNNILKKLTYKGLQNMLQVKMWSDSENQTSSTTKMQRHSESQIPECRMPEIPINNRNHKPNGTIPNQ